MPASHLLPIHPGLAPVNPTVLLLCTTITVDPWHSVRLLLPPASGYVGNSPAIIIINQHPSVSTIVTLPVVLAIPAMPVMSTVPCSAMPVNLTLSLSGIGQDLSQASQLPPLADQG